MSSLGQIVAGIVYEMNNLINFIYINRTPEKYIQSLLNLIEMSQLNRRQPQAEIKTYREDIEFEFLEQDLIEVLSLIKMGATQILEIVTSLGSFSCVDETEIKICF